MKALLSFSLFLMLSLPSLANENVKYVGGTVPEVSSGSTGKLDLTSPTSLNFEYSPGNRLTIPYASIDSFEYSTEVVRHLGVLPAIVVALLRARQHRHTFRIAYHDQNAVAQVAIFEVPKQTPVILRSVLEARSPHNWKTRPACLKPD